MSNIKQTAPNGSSKKKASQIKRGARRTVLAEQARPHVSKKRRVNRRPRARGPHAGFLKDGSRMAFLEEVRDPGIPTRTLGDLSHSELVDLVMTRFHRRPFLPLRMLGVPGVVNKKRAIAEVRSGTYVGHHLMDIEKRLIRFQLERR